MIIDYDEMIEEYKINNANIPLDDLIIYYDMLEDFADNALELLQCKNIFDALKVSNKIELWLLAFYNEFAHLK